MMQITCAPWAVATCKKYMPLPRCEKSAPASAALKVLLTPACCMPLCAANLASFAIVIYAPGPQRPSVRTAVICLMPAFACSQHWACARPDASKTRKQAIFFIVEKIYFLVVAEIRRHY